MQVITSHCQLKPINKGVDGETESFLDTALPLFGDETNGIIVLLEESVVYVCRRAGTQNGVCVYGLCTNCYSERHNKNGRNGSCRCKELKSPLEASRNTCLHNLNDLKTEQNLWWCAPKYIGSEKWFGRCHGCFGCRKMFVLVNKKGLPEGWTYPAVSTFAKSVCAKYEEWEKISKQLAYT